MQTRQNGGHDARLLCRQTWKGVTVTIDPAVEYERDFYINHSEACVYNNYERIRGAHLTIPENADNFSLNVAYYYVDDVLAYDQTMRNQVMNTRLRIDFMTLWPELTNNNIRLCGNPTQAYNSGDNSEDGTEAGGTIITFRLAT